MEPKNFRFGGGAADTMIHPIVLIAMIIAVILIFALKRKYVIVPFLAVTFLSPVGQVLVVGGVHIFVYRILILAGCLRFIWTKFTSSTEIFPGGINSLDKVFMVWATCRAAAPVFLVMQGGAVINSFGWLLDAFGGYFVFRFLIQDREDIYRVVRAFAVLASIFAVCAMNEKFRHQNIFGYLGGVTIVPEFRDGGYRPQATFSHPLLLGSFAATSLPLFILLWKTGKAKALSALGVVSSTVITIASASSTPLMAYAAAILGVCFWPFRRKMRAVRWGLVIGLVSLHLVMKAPVWFIITHIDIIGASSGYHRAELIDQFVKHFRDWWLVGTNENGKWGWDMYDLANEFVAEGEAGGLASFVSFIALISICFSWLGKARKLLEGDRKEEWFVWLFGCALFANIVDFFGISYFDQTRVAWFALLIMISTATGSILSVKEVPARTLAARPYRSIYPPPVVSSVARGKLV